MPDPNLIDVRSHYDGNTKKLIVLVRTVGVACETPLWIMLHDTDQPQDDGDPHRLTRLAGFRYAVIDMEDDPVGKYISVGGVPCQSARSRRPIR